MEKLKYKISSRATILLGRESVSKVESAIIELIKNSYDADADICFVYFDTKDNCLYLIDNGIGMTKKVIEDYWMTIIKRKNMYLLEVESNPVKKE